MLDPIVAEAHMRLTHRLEVDRFRSGFFTDGRVVTWEYPRAAPDGDQMELVEVMEIRDGLIWRHRVYWGWYALNVLKES